MPYKDYELHKQKSRENYYKNRLKKIAQAKAYYKTNKKKRDQQKVEWAKRNPDKVAAYAAKYSKSEKGKIAIKKAHEKHYNLYPEKVAARGAVRNAIRRGEIVRPVKCSQCKVIDKIYAHHHAGYDEANQLNIMWLCHQCHRRIHHEDPRRP